MRLASFSWWRTVACTTCPRSARPRAVANPIPCGEEQPVIRIVFAAGIRAAIVSGLPAASAPAGAPRFGERTRAARLRSLTAAERTDTSRRGRPSSGAPICVWRVRPSRALASLATMKPANFEYAAPDTLDDALALLAEHGSAAKVLAGGQSLVPRMAFRLERPRLLVDIGRVHGLDEITTVDGVLAVGARVTHRRLELGVSPDP